MSLSGGEPGSFFGPLSGKTTTFLLDGREDNLSFAKMMVGLLARAHASCAILDLDAFYASNSDRIFASMDAGTARSTTVRVPAPESDVEREFSTVFDAQQKVLIIDSLNSLYHLISLGDGSSRSRKLTFALASLSYLARTSEKAVILTMYRREGFYRAGTGRSISTLSDNTVSVKVNDGEVAMTAERGTAWSGGAFSSRTP
jgi:hypothetical protein